MNNYHDITREKYKNPVSNYGVIGIDYILNQYNQKSDKSDYLDDFFYEKQKMLGEIIYNINSRIYNRKKLNYDNTYKIDKNICDIHTVLFNTCGQAGMQNNYGSGSNQLQLEKAVFELEKQKRMEDVNCWKDVSFLEKDLMNAVQEYQDTKKRQKLILEGSEDRYQNETKYS